jgi:hypothetical protein
MPISLSGSLNLSGSLTTTGTITATTLVVQTITSSISSITGSTNFGSLSSNTHTFTGSINASGSGNFSGSITATDLIVSDTYANDPLIKLVTTTSGNVEVQMRTATTTYNAGIGVITSGYDFGLFTNNTTRLFISASGNVGIGTSSPYSKLDVAGSISINGRPVIDNSSAELYIGGITGVSGRGTDMIAFYTANAERMRITSAGLVGIGIDGVAFLLDVGGGVNGVTQNVCRIGNTAGYTNGLTVSKNVSNNYTFNFGDNSIIQSSYTYGNTVTSPRTVYVNSSGVFGGISSILASKTNIKEFDTKWLYDLKPVQFNYRKKDESEQYTDEFNTELFYGLIAEETELINKEICTYNNKKLIGIEYSKLTPVLVKAIQELTARVQYLENK